MMTMDMNTVAPAHKVIIGRAEAISFLDFGLLHVPAKVDTGAYGSAVHAVNCQLSKDGKTLSFDLLGGHPVCGNMSQTITTTQFKTVLISNSFGQTEQRYEVELKVKVGTQSFITPFSLADRSKKIYPILLGRKLLNKRFLVDTSVTRINRKELKQNYNISFPADKQTSKEESS